MDNDATKILNPESENQKTEATHVEQKEVKNGSKFMGRSAAATVGAAFGVGAVEAVEHIYNKTTAEEEPIKADETQAEAESPTAAETIVETGEGIRVANVDDTATTATQTTDATLEDPNAVPSDASYIDNSAPTTPSSGFDSDNEVHVVGVAVQDNGHGGIATIAGLQSGEETAIVVDVDTDGTIDIVGIDENHNGQFEQNEWHDASEAHMSTGQVVGAYVEEAHEQGVHAVVTDLDDGSQYQIVESESGYGLASPENTPDRNIYEASNDILSDDMPDYMNDADTSIMDV